MGSAAQPLLNLRDRMYRFPQRALDTVTRPVTMFEEKFPGMAAMLGIHPEVSQQADPDMVREANQSFVDAMNRQKQEKGKR